MRYIWLHRSTAVSYTQLAPSDLNTVIRIIHDPVLISPLVPMAKTASKSTTPAAAVQQPAFEQPKRQVLIVDDHPIFRNGIIQLINHEPDLHVCGEICSAAQALGAVEDLKPDIVVLDLSIQGTNGIELMKSVRALHPHLPVLMVSMHDEGIYCLLYTSRCV